MIVCKRYILLLISFFFITFLYSQNSQAYYQALYIHNFLRHIEFGDGNKDITIGVLGTSPIIPELQNLSNKSSSNVKVIKVINPNDIAQCDILYVPRNSYKNMSTIKPEDRAKILIITEDEEMIKKGADISFFLQDSKLRFYLNTENIQRKKSLKVSSGLSQLGVPV